MTRETFIKYRNLTDTKQIEKELEIGFQIEELMIKHIAQAEKKKGEKVFNLNVREGLVLEEQDMSGVPVQRCC